MDLSKIYLKYPGSSRGYRFRVIWSGFRDSRVRLDLALIHVERPTPSFFTWSTGTELVQGTEVVCVGFPDHELSFAAGELLSDVKSDDHVAWRVTHTAPLADGDSGGPLCTLDGKLVAVNYGSELASPVGGVLRCVGLRPDLSWLEALIRRDRVSVP